MVEQSFIKVDAIIRKDDIVCIPFSVSHGMEKYFNTFSFEYSIAENNSIPDSILLIPFVCNVIPLTWLTDSVLILKELDEAFSQSIDDFKRGYAQMYPMLAFKGNIRVGTLVKNDYIPTKNLVLFSGGVDAITTTLRHKNEDIELLTLWGSADFPLDDVRGWNIQWNNIEYNTSQLKLTPHYMRTNFYEFIPSWSEQYKELIVDIGKEGISWWHEIQHGIGIIGHAAPFAFLNKVGVIYIASSYDESQKPYTCASDPTIDNNVRFGSSKIVHDAYELTRQDKVGYIVSECVENKYKFNIHVCLKQYQDTNCCKCEKCYRTIMSLLAEGQDPNEYGFEKSNIKDILYDLKYKINLSEERIFVFKQIQDRIIENRANVRESKLVEWAMKTNLDKINLNFRKILRPYLSTIRVFVCNIFRRK